MNGTVAGKARFASAKPPCGGKVASWLHIDVDPAVRMAVHYNDSYCYSHWEILSDTGVWYPHREPSLLTTLNKGLLVK